MKTSKQHTEPLICVSNSLFSLAHDSCKRRKNYFSGIQWMTSPKLYSAVMMPFSNIHPPSVRFQQGGILDNLMGLETRVPLLGSFKLNTERPPFQNSCQRFLLNHNTNQQIQEEPGKTSEIQNLTFCGECISVCIN